MASHSPYITDLLLVMYAGEMSSPPTSSKLNLINQSVKILVNAVPAYFEPGNAKVKRKRWKVMTN